MCVGGGEGRVGEGLRLWFKVPRAILQQPWELHQSEGCPGFGFWPLVMVHRSLEAILRTASIVKAGGDGHELRQLAKGVKEPFPEVRIKRVRGMVRLVPRNLSTVLVSFLLGWFGGLTVGNLEILILNLKSTRFSI